MRKISDLFELARQDSIYASKRESTPVPITDKLRQLSAELAIPPVTTYQLLVLENPGLLTGDQGSLLTFSDDNNVQKSESQFYVIHQIIEAELKHVLNEFSKNDCDIIVIYDHLRTVLDFQSYLQRELQTDHFSLFRKYYTNNQGYPGPSGFYSAAFPTFDVIINHEFVYDNKTPRFDLLPTNKIGRDHYYITREDLLREIEGRDNGRTYPAKIVDLVREFLLEFRQKHLGLVSRFAPDVYRSTASGTGSDYEVTTKDFLDQKIRQTKKSKKD